MTVNIKCLEQFPAQKWRWWSNSKLRLYTLTNDSNTKGRGTGFCELVTSPPPFASGSHLSLWIVYVVKEMCVCVCKIVLNSQFLILFSVPYWEHICLYYSIWKICLVCAHLAFLAEYALCVAPYFNYSTPSRIAPTIFNQTIPQNSTPPTTYLCAKEIHKLFGP